MEVRGEVREGRKGEWETQRTMYTRTAQLSLVNFYFTRAPLRDGAVHIQGRSPLLS